MAVNRIVFPLAFAIGLAAIVWAGAGFAGSSSLALAMTAAIALAYLIGTQELRAMRKATAGLEQALAASPDASLDAWLAQVPAALREPVRLRIEGERVALPGPPLTPYLVGLLVMLGMLGTFLGLVLTFKGTVFAVEGSADLQAMRTALAAPIRGLGLAFGTSVAGVSASAMLGLMSALARRERSEAARRLDGAIATVLRPHSPAHQREQTLHALQAQARALPLLVDRLQSMSGALEQRSRELDAQLIERQERFHREAGSAYTGLAASVGASLQESLSCAARMAGESIRPVLEATMAGIAQDARELQQRQVQAAQAQLQALGAEVGETLARTQAAQADGDRQRLQAWTGTLESTLVTLRDEWQRIGSQALAAQQALSDTLERTAGEIGERAGADARRTLQEVERLLARAEELTTTRIASEQTWLQEQARRMDEANALWRTGLASLRDEEAARAAASVDRLQAMQTATQASLATTQSAAQAGFAELQANATQSLQALQSTVASHLATLGTALEAPMTRLLETASEAPKAAAQLIAQLRQEMSDISERDRRTAEEHAILARELAALLQTIAQANEAQREALASMSRSAAQALEQATAQASQTLERAGTQVSGTLDAAGAQFTRTLLDTGTGFSESLDAQSARTAQTSARLEASAIELASLGEAFEHGVQIFSASNTQLIESLQRIEGTLARTITRSDEQLAYYVGQAREVIDLSVSAQQGILEDLRRLHQAAANPARGDS